MKIEHYKLDIEKPCNQDWSSMTKTKNGKFCSNCSKTVIDFTLLTDNEIIQIIDKKSDMICGRLSKQQLNRLIETKKQTNNSKLFKTLTGLVLFGTTLNSFAKTNWFSRQSPKIEIVSRLDKNLNFPNQDKQNKKSVSDSLNVLQGKVIDSESKEPLPGVIVFIKNTTITTTTDLDGNFKLTIPDNLLTNKIHIIINYIGYETTESIIYKTELSNSKKIYLIQAQQALLGEVIVIKKKRWWQFWKNKHLK